MAQGSERVQTRSLAVDALLPGKDVVVRTRHLTADRIVEIGGTDASFTLASLGAPVAEHAGIAKLQGRFAVLFPAPRILDTRYEHGVEEAALFANLGRLDTHFVDRVTAQAVAAVGDELAILAQTNAWAAQILVTTKPAHALTRALAGAPLLGEGKTLTGLPVDRGGAEQLGRTPPVAPAATAFSDAEGLRVGADRVTVSGETTEARLALRDEPSGASQQVGLTSIAGDAVELVHGALRDAQLLGGLPTRELFPAIREFAQARLIEPVVLRLGCVVGNLEKSFVVRPPASVPPASVPPASVPPASVSPRPTSSLAGQPPRRTAETTRATRQPEENPIGGSFCKAWAKTQT